MSLDLREGILQDARLLLDRRLQFTAKELVRDKDLLRLSNAYGSPCSICSPGDTPTWSIDAEEVETRDATERVVFRNAILRVFGVPIAFVPWISMPGPNVARADGLLPPKIFRTNAIGSGFSLPYFKVLGDHADATLTPFFTSRSGAGFEFEHRVASSFGNLNLSGSLASGK